MTGRSIPRETAGLSRSSSIWNTGVAIVTVQGGIPDCSSKHVLSMTVVGAISSACAKGLTNMHYRINLYFGLLRGPPAAIVLSPRPWVFGTRHCSRSSTRRGDY